MVGNKSPIAKPTRALPKGKGIGASSKEHSIGFSTKGKSVGVFSKKGKEKVSESDHISQKQKRTFHKHSPSDVNFKRARYGRPNHSNDSDRENDTGFKDLPIPDLQQDAWCPQDAHISDSIDIPIMTAGSIIKETQDPLMTAITPVQVTPDDVVEITPLQSVPTTIGSLFVNPVEDRVQESILRGLKAVVDMISNQDSTQALLANRVRVF